MQRYFIQNDDVHGHIIIIKHKEDVHHIRNVMRMKAGDQIICTDENELARKCVIADIDANRVTAEIIEALESNTEMPVHVTIAQGLPKKDKLEWIIQKGTELGANQFNIFQADRSVAKWHSGKIDQKLQRLKKIAQAASEQSGRNRTPSIDYYKNNAENVLVNDQHYDLLLFAYEEEAKTSSFHSINSFLKKCQPGMKICIYIGPEGGFSEREVELFQKYQAKSVRLGPRILRTETAAMYALSCISFYFEEMASE